MTGPAVAVNPFTPETPADGNPFAPVPTAGSRTLRKLNVPMAASEATQVGAGPANPNPTHLPEPFRSIGQYLVDPALEHPLTTMAMLAAPGVLIGAGIPAFAVGAGATAAMLPRPAAYAGQKAAELTLPPDIRAQAEQFPDRVPGREAATMAGAAVLPSVIGAAWRSFHAPTVEPPAAVPRPAPFAAPAPLRTPVLEPPATSVGGVTRAPDLSPPTESARSMVPPQQGPLQTRAAIEAAEAAPDAGAPALAPTGLEERAAGLSIPKAAREAVSTATTQAFTNPYAPIATEHPALSDALQSAGAMTRAKAEAFGRQLAGRVTSDLTPQQAEHFETARVAANLEAEASRKANGAEATANQAVNHRMEVRKLAQQDFDAENAKADAAQEAGRARAQALAESGATAEHIQDVLDDAQKDAEEIRKPAQADYDLAIKKGDEGHDALQKDAFAKKQAAARATVEAVTLREKVPNGVEQEPWFQAALAKHNAMVEPFGEHAALRAGVDPGALRKTSVGYARLTPQETINEELLQRTQEAAAEGKSTVPRKGLRLRVLGQKPNVNALLPAGASEPLQGPVNTLKPEPSSVATPTAATRETGSAKEFRGAEGYSTDYRTNVARDLGDKVTKAAKNQVYQALSDESMKPNARVRKLLPEENPAPGEKLIAFNDQKDIIQPPAKTDPNYQTVQRFAVTPDVADAFARYQQTSGPASHLAKGAAAVNKFVMRLVLSNPLVAAGHTLTEASNVSRGLPAGEPRAVQAITGLPVVKSLDALRRAAGVDMQAPETTARLQRLALSGSLRIGDERGQGWVDAAHRALFGPNGVDTRLRLVASEDAEAAWTKAGGSIKDPAFTGFERDYVNGHSGNYIGKNQGTAIQELNKSGLTPFIAIGRAKLGGSLKAIGGGGGPPGEGIGARILRTQRGPLGQAAAIAGAGYLLSGHAPTQNAPGHETDMASGVYHLPDGSYKYFRGSPDEAAKLFGAQAKEVYLRKGFTDPSSAAALRLLEPIAFAKKGDRVSESVRAAANTAFAFVGPGAALGTQLLTGHELYLDKDGALGSVQGLHLSKDADLTDRLVGAARNLNAGVAIGMAPATPNARSATSAVLGNLNPFTEAKAGSAPRAAAERHDEGAWQQAKVSQIFQEHDPAKRQQIVQDAIKEAAENGFTGPMIRVTLTKAAARANIDRSASSAIRFQNQIKGAGAPVPAYSKNNPFTKSP